MPSFDVRWAAPLRRALKVGWPLAVALLLGACAATQVAPGEPLTPGPDAGIVVLSVTRSGWRDFDWSLELKGPDSWVGNPIQVFAHSASRDWKGGPKRNVTPASEPEGRLFVLRLKPGTYRIDHWRGSSRNFGAYEEGYNVAGSDVGLSFAVRAGAIMYLGNVNLVLPDELNYQANLMPSFYRIETGLKPERDLALLRSKYPGVAANAVQDEPIRFANAGKPLRYYVYNVRVGDEQDRK